MKPISVVIPTLQKNLELLLNLINVLEKDSNVDEIIIIDNSLKGLNYTSNKLKIIIPSTNLYVNPSWNLGVKSSVNENVAILNDDITIPENFCSNVFERFTDDMGIVGYNIDFVKETQELLPSPPKQDMNLIVIANMCSGWGVAIFFKKTNYIEIPDDLKIFYGDDWLIYQNKKRKKKIYSINGQKIYHYGSLSSASGSLNPIAKNDDALYKKLTRDRWGKIFSFNRLYKGFTLTVLGLKFSFHYDKRH